jgi:hypothetical protein
VSKRKQKTVLTVYTSADEEFLTDFMQRRGYGCEKDDLGFYPDRWGHARREAIIALLRSNVPLSSKGLRRDLAKELEHLYWPTAQTKQHERHSLNHVKALALDEKIHMIADELREQGARDPVQQAEEQVAEQWGFASAQALNKWLRRYMFGLHRKRSVLGEGATKKQPDKNHGKKVRRQI